MLKNRRGKAIPGQKDVPLKKFSYETLLELAQSASTKLVSDGTDRIGLTRIVKSAFSIQEIREQCKIVDKIIKTRRRLLKSLPDIRTYPV